jgi:uncharacterized GH25 family protein
MKKIIITIMFFMITGAGLLCAHEWFAALTSAKAAKAGDSVTIGVYSTHHLISGENIPQPVQCAFFMLQNNSIMDIKQNVARNEEQKFLGCEFAVPAGAPTMVVVNRQGRFSSVTSAGIKTASKFTAGALGVTVVKTTYSEVWCKIYVNPDSQDTSFAKPLGLPLEIVPVTNPADIAAGKNALFKVLLRGKPVRNAELSATYKSYNNKEKDAWALKDLKTDASGIVSIAIPSAPAAKDVWIVKAAYTGKASGNPLYDEESFNSWVSFVVKQ